jgi:hypothetical protein
VSEGNKNVVLVAGPPNTGKTTSLMQMKNQASFVYLNTDLKELPFKHNFLAAAEIAEPEDILEYINQIEENEVATGGVIDTLTFLMGMYERMRVKTSHDTQKAWGQYGDFYRDFIHRVKSGTKDYAILAHTDTVFNETKGEYETKVPVKGAVGKVGVEADFSTILGTKQVTIKQLEKLGIENDLLHITDEEREDGFKFVFQTRITKETLGEKMRSAMGLWNRNELYIDNNLEQVFSRLRKYYS